MSTTFTSITDEQAALIESCAMFFVASAEPRLADGPGGVGPVNVSPKGGVKLHLLSRNRVAYLDWNGSGNETARHAGDGGPVTVMVCSFSGEDAAIVRLYGHAKAVPVAESTLVPQLEAEVRGRVSSARQVIEIDVQRTTTSCGYGVPVMTLVRERRREDRGRRFKPTS